MLLGDSICLPQLYRSDLKPDEYAREKNVEEDSFEPESGEEDDGSEQGVAGVVAPS